MFLGLDLGTTNVKVLVVDAAGRVAADGSTAVDRFCTPDGGVEQDVDQIWQATCAAVRQAAAAVDASRIQAIGVSSQGGTLQLLDPLGKPIGRALSWLDSRGRPFDRQLVDELGEEFFAAHVGYRGSALTPGQVLRLRQEAPREWARAASLGFVGDVIVGRLCGRRAHDATSLSIALLLNPSLARADPELLARLELREEQLPDLLPATTPAGRLRRDVAEQVGLVAGIPVSPAVHDQYAGALGAGSVREGDVCFGTGTAWVLVANDGRLRVPVTPQAIVCPHPVAGLYGQMLSMVNGGSAIEWVRSLASGAISPQAIDDALEAVPPGSEGLVFWPLLVPGLGSGPAARGGRIDGLTLAHSVKHLLRAALEGLACELARHLRLLAGADFPVRRLVMCGRGAASRVTPAIVADVTGQPVACVSEPAVSAFGAATIARALLEPGANLAQLADRFAPPRRTVLAGEHGGTYRRLLEKYLQPFVQ